MTTLPRCQFTFLFTTTNSTVLNSCVYPSFDLFTSHGGIAIRGKISVNQGSAVHPSSRIDYASCRYADAITPIPSSHPTTELPIGLNSSHPLHSFFIQFRCCVVF
ncbi:hypothetical protein NP233_g12150 [Leucocoprinus birnbaumii]|uniref:Uncharacterized protein n=1 Tax=Leucocoprinus birnbaumii TaxID=56174 RepID=A0AAD5VFM4_9AGAR|nr:hypothetical protein NP233_g12150 [Leucocoprinus birnbaumii]